MTTEEKEVEERIIEGRNLKEIQTFLKDKKYLAHRRYVVGNHVIFEKEGRIFEGAIGSIGENTYSIYVDRQAKYFNDLHQDDRIFNEIYVDQKKCLHTAEVVLPNLPLPEMPQFPSILDAYRFLPKKQINPLLCPDMRYLISLDANDSMFLIDGNREMYLYRLVGHSIRVLENIVTGKYRLVDWKYYPNNNGKEDKISRMLDDSFYADKLSEIETTKPMDEREISEIWKINNRETRILGQTGRLSAKEILDQCLLHMDLLYQDKNAWGQKFMEKKDTVPESKRQSNLHKRVLECMQNENCAMRK